MLILWLLCTTWCAYAMGNRPEPYVIENATVYFNGFMSEYNKAYANDAEKSNRFDIFKKNLEKINRLNEDPDGAIFGIDETADLTAEEYNEMSSCLLDTPDTDTTVSDVQCTVLTDKDITAKDAPAAYSWREQGAVTPVRDQGSCRSCWAIVATVPAIAVWDEYWRGVYPTPNGLSWSIEKVPCAILLNSNFTIGQLEARNYMKHKKLIQLSPQQLVDCDKLSSGCGGGTMVKAYRSLIGYIGGCMTEKDYPYVGRTQTCRSDKSKIVVKPVRCSSYDLKSQDKVRQQLHKIGPIGIAVRNEGLRFYKGGIFKDWQCSEGKISHAVLLVGYGTEKGQDYWLVKNSRGVQYGEEGYFRMQRGENHTSCGMMNTYMATASIE